jgi:phospholipid/cholesterol/gamma-HCH transport system ATP-binding protein
MTPSATGPLLKVDGLTIGFDETVIQRDISFAVSAGSIFAIMGGSGSGKSTLLKALIGLLRPSAGTVHIGEEDYWAADLEGRARLDQGFGVLFQRGALWTSMTVADNVALPLRLLSTLDEPSIRRLVQVKLALVGLDVADDTMPGDLSGGMVKRAGLARALALDPAILMLDEPSSGLDPISSKRFDDLIRDLRDGFGMTVVLVSHDLESLLEICDDGIFLDAESKTAIAHGSPAQLRDACDHPTVRAFMHRDGQTEASRTTGGDHEPH